MQELTKERAGKIFRYSLLAVTFIGLLISGIVFRVPPYKILPLFNSLFIVMMQAKANRYAYILGGINSILYAIIYIFTGLYALAMYAFCFSFPIGLLTFFRWNKNSYEKSTRFSSMNTKWRLLTALAFFAVFGITILVLRLLGSDFALLDTSVSLLGILVSILTMLARVEYAPLWLLSSVLSLALNIQVTISDITFFPYTISATYNLICTATALFNVFRLYKKQTTTVNEPHPDII